MTIVAKVGFVKCVAKIYVMGFPTSIPNEPVTNNKENSGSL